MPRLGLRCGGGWRGAPLSLDRACSAVDEEFETVSTQLLKRTQAMLNKYRLLLLEESRVGWPSPSSRGLCPSPAQGGREAGRLVVRSQEG